jgi:hypothetical protein
MRWANERSQFKAMNRRSRQLLERRERLERKRTGVHHRLYQRADKADKILQVSRCTPSMGIMPELDPEGP